MQEIPLNEDINNENPGFRDVSANEREYYENLIRKFEMHLIYSKNKHSTI